MRSAHGESAWLHGRRDVRSVKRPPTGLAAAMLPTQRESSSCNGRRCASCYCFDLCRPDRVQAFASRARGAVVTSRQSPWFAYFSAVYNGHAPLPLPLANISLYFEATSAWHESHPAAPSPFRPCVGKHLPRCGASTCASWEVPLLKPPQTPTEATTATYWGIVPAYPARKGLMATQMYATVSRIMGEGPGRGSAAKPPFRRADLEGVRLDGDSWGREVLSNNTWVEVIRQDLTPDFEEGMTPPECASLPARPTAAQLLACFSRRHPPGCWARPARGSGVWINTGRTEAAAWFPPPPEHLSIAEAILSAASRGVDSLQYQMGDPVVARTERLADLAGHRGTRGPLLVITRPACLARAQGVRACFPRELEVRAGWHNVPCECNESLNLANCAAGGPGTQAARF